MPPQHGLDGRRGNGVDELEEFPANALIAPSGILPGQAEDQALDLRPERRAARAPAAAELGPLAADQLTVPAQQGLRPDGQARPLRARRAAAQRGEEEAIRRLPVRPRDLPAQDADFVPEGQQLDRLRPPRR